jgi:hypothetical protein
MPHLGKTSRAVGDSAAQGDSNEQKELALSSSYSRIADRSCCGLAHTAGWSGHFTIKLSAVADAASWHANCDSDACTNQYASPDEHVSPNQHTDTNEHTSTNQHTYTDQHPAAHDYIFSHQHTYSHDDIPTYGNGCTARWMQHLLL